MDPTKNSRVPASASSILEGDARHVRLASLLQLAEIEMYTAKLWLGEVGFIAVRNGSVVASQALGLDGVEAVFELFLHLEGRVRVMLDETIEGAPLATTISLVMDGCRLIDEWQQLSQDRWVIASVAEVADAFAPALTAMRPVLMAMERGARLEAALAEVGIARAKAVPALCALVEAGVIVPAKAVRPLSLVAQPTPDALQDAPGDVDELIAQARRLVRANDFARAEQLFLRALEQRPNDRVIAQNLRHLALRRTAAA